MSSLIKPMGLTRLDHRRSGLALLTAYLLFGLMFMQALAYFLLVPWSRGMTVAVYLAAAILGAFSALTLKERLRSIANFQNMLCAAFLLIVMASMVFSVGQTAAVGSFLGYMPFMVALPYVCGLLMRPPDIRRFQRCVLVAAWVMLPLLLFDRLVFSGSSDGGRWTFFGLDHSPLLIGALLAAAMMASCVRLLDASRHESRDAWPLRPWQDAQLALMTIVLVWVSARGWLIAGLAGCATVCIAANHASVLRRVAVLSLIAFAAMASWKILPSIDSEFGSVYRQAANSSFEWKNWLGVDRPAPELSKPIFGDASCEPFHQGVNSIEMRWVLYQEAIAMFLENPMAGVGAARFGYRSCAGPDGFPHSTVLQAFAELGLTGGGIYLALLSFAGIRLLRHRRSDKRGGLSSDHAFALAMFVAFILADQLYGNYFMATGSWLLSGIVGGLCAADQRGAAHAI